MNRKITLPLVILFILLMAAPASAAVQMDVNGRTYTDSNLTVQDGVTYVPLAVVSHILGCTVSQEGNNLTVQENQDCLTMTIGSTAARLNDEEKLMPQAPQYIDGQVYVPVNFVCSCFGASVTWNDGQEIISISYTETQDGMTAEDLLAKASQKMMEANRYKMNLNMDMTMDMTTQQSGQDPEKMNLIVNNISDCWMQTDPILLYMKQNSNISAPGTDLQGVQNFQTEILLNEDAMYMTMPQYGWVKMDMQGVNMQELMKLSYTQDAAASLQQMQDMGMSISLGNEQERNGIKYWVVDVAMGSDVFKSSYFKQISGALAASQPSDIMQRLFDGMDFDFAYSVLINQNTFYTDYMDLQGKATVKIDVPDAAAPSYFTMDMDLKGNYTLSDYGVVFQVPDVSQAIDYNTIDLQNQ